MSLYLVHYITAPAVSGRNIRCAGCNAIPSGGHGGRCPLTHFIGEERTGEREVSRRRSGAVGEHSSPVPVRQVLPTPSPGQFDFVSPVLRLEYICGGGLKFSGEALRRLVV